MPLDRLLVNVESPSGGRHTVALPSDAPIDDLMPGLLEACEGSSESAGWTLAPIGEAALEGGTTLGESGLFPGAVLVLMPPAFPSPHRGEGQGEGPWGSLPLVAQRIRAGLRSPAGPPAQPKSIDRLGDSDYLRLLEDAIAAPAAGASTVVAVMSVHPGAGTTTVTALLATLLSRLRSEELVAVDANPESGALSHWMVPDSRMSGDTYRSLFADAPTPEQVRAALVSAVPGLAVLPGPADLSRVRSAHVQDWSRLIEHLRHLHHTVLIDCVAGFQRAACRAALDAADHVVLVSRPHAGAIDTLPPAVESLQRRGRAVVVVANQAHRRARTMRSARGLQQVTIAYEAKPAAQLKAGGFAWGSAPASWQESLRELAAVLIGSKGAPAP